MMLTEEIRYDFPLSDSEYTHRVYWNDIMHRISYWLKVIKPLGLSCNSLFIWTLIFRDQFFFIWVAEKWYFVDLLWEKIVLVMEKKKSKLKPENLQNVRNHHDNLFKQWKVKTIFETECFFNLFLEVFQTNMLYN